ncbi:nuclear transport factor 2 family protein [Frankia sp. Mgl5]|uniref:nuclear transport factor 2 family protein n=1 Tax=Frankia sp. Mgl5 TaxID=2933793 RepID=UPI00200C48D8|nr:nuclear transport factor 2 family protein [Frankia sp. Mgl5]MCK9928897.1 nuclear transport factor 2 family protein [Frankia sp. Mgl5]
MSVEDELKELRRELRYVTDRLAILDCVMKQSRGHDRHDIELMASVYHNDGVDEHGPVVKLGPDYGEYANQAHSSVFVDHLHNITTHTCEIDGDEAHCESYVIGAMRSRDGKTVHIFGGRYLDRVERRDGVWRIALRRCTLEWTMNGDTSLLSSGSFTGFIKGTWDKNDPSYARPLNLEKTPVKKW